MHFIKSAKNYPEAEKIHTNIKTDDSVVNSVD